ncbi:hypothetical protein LINPERPRIM_LOCUS7023, partial [Linum perenne]
NWSVFERIHTKNRNKLEHKRLSDLVFINYNLKLKNKYVIWFNYHDKLYTYSDTRMLRLIS